MITVKDIKTLNSLKNHKVGELIKVEDTGVTYEYTEEGWKLHEGQKVGISMYDLNKQYYAKKSNLTKEDILSFKELFHNYENDTGGKYFMLLNNGENYYTIFTTGINKKDNLSFEDSIIDFLITEFKNIKHIEKNEYNSIEIWGTLNEEIGLYVLFDYTRGVVECL